jgi:hypothetical protein
MLPAMVRMLCTSAKFRLPGSEGSELEPRGIYRRNPAVLVKQWVIMGLLTTDH